MRKVAEAASAVLHPSAWLHWIKLARHVYRFHVKQRKLLEKTDDVRISPTADFRNGQRISIGEGSRIGEFVSLWAGDARGQISIGVGCLLGPYVFITASNYGLDRDRPILDQQRQELDVLVGDGVWLGAHVLVTAGVSIGDGAIVGMGSVVTRDVEPYSIVAGVPARPIGTRT